MKKLTMIVLAMLLSIVGSRAQAYLYAWSDIPDVIDGINSELPGGQDIITAWHATDGNYHYFRMDLRSAPSASENGLPNFAGLYGIYIDQKPGGAIGSDPLQTYVPDSLSGIDNIIDSHYEPNFGGFYLNDFHIWTSNQTFLKTVPSAVSQSENGGTTLEWAISVSALDNSEFTWWAVTHDIGASAPTYDQTSPQSSSPVPLPAAGWMFLTGLFGLLKIHRRNIK